MIDYLITRRSIKDFLGKYNEKQWESLIVYLVEYGIESLRRNHNIISLSLNDIRCIVEDYKRGRPIREVKNTNLKRKPSSDWRKGEPIASRSNSIREHDASNKFIYDTSIQDGSYASEKLGLHEEFNPFKQNHLERNPEFNKYHRHPIYHNHNNHGNHEQAPHIYDVNNIHPVQHIQPNHYDEQEYTRSKSNQSKSHTIYPEWWGHREHNSSRARNHNYQSIHNTLNKGYNQNLSVIEKKKLIDRSRLTSEFVPNYNCRSKSYVNLNERERVYDKVIKPYAESRIKEDVDRDKDFHIRSVANNNRPQNNSLSPTFNQNVNINVNYSTSPIQSVEVVQSNNPGVDRTKKVETNYMISYDKNLRPQAVKEKSVEKYVKKSKPQLNPQSNYEVAYAPENPYPQDQDDERGYDPQFDPSSQPMQENLAMESLDEEQDYQKYYSNNNPVINEEPQEEIGNSYYRNEVNRSIRDNIRPPQNLNNNSNYINNNPQSQLSSLSNSHENQNIYKNHGQQPHLALNVTPTNLPQQQPQISQTNNNNSNFSNYNENQGRKPQKQNQNSNLNESACSLSSFTPSERTKEFFQREVLNNNYFLNRQSQNNQLSSEFNTETGAYNYNLADSGQK